MRLSDFIKIMEEIAPPIYKESYDNVGLMVGDRNSEINKVLVALDCTKAVIEEGRSQGVQLILTHHPLLFRKPSSITEDTLQGEKIRALIKNDIALYSSHTNWDSVCGGLNDEFVKLLGFNSQCILEENKMGNNAGVGRIVVFEEEKYIGEVIEVVKEKLMIPTVRFAGDPNSKVKRIALINGSGQDYFQLALENKADLIITGDTTYHFVSDYSEMGVSILDVGHFNSEWPVFISLVKKMEHRLNSQGVEVIISKTTKDPYIFL